MIGMRGGRRSDVFCELEQIDNGVLVHFVKAVERKGALERRGALQGRIESAVAREMGVRPALWELEVKTVFCKAPADVAKVVDEAQSEQVKIRALRTDGLLDASPIGFSEYLA